MARSPSSTERRPVAEVVRRWAGSSARWYSGVKLGRIGLYGALVAVAAGAARIDWRAVPTTVAHVGLTVGAISLLALAADYHRHPHAWEKLDVAPKPLWANRHGRRRVDFALRWAALVALSAAVLPYAARASLSPGTASILDVQLAGSAEAWQQLGVEPDSLRDALASDFLLIATYVALGALLASWAGSYYRLEPVRRARGYACLAVGAAGVLDVLENLLLWLGSHDRGPQVVWPLAAAAAWGKLVLLAVVAGYVAVGFQSWVSTPTLLRHLLWEESAKSRPQRTQESAESVREIFRERPQAPRAGRLGIALSGGGIRASSITLGALQLLEMPPKGNRRRLGPPLGWEQAAVVTAISGGSNMAAAWSIARSSLHEDRPDQHGQVREAAPPTEGARPWSTDLGRYKMTPEEKHLLRNLGYLASNRPRGDAEEWSPASTTPSRSRTSSPLRPAAVATVVTGFTVNVLLLLLGIWVVVRPLGWLFRAVSGPACAPGHLSCLSGQPHLVTPGLLWTGVGFVALLAWVGIARRLSLGSDRVSWRRLALMTAQGVAYGSLVLGLVLLSFLGLFPFAMEWVRALDWGTVSLASVGGLLGTVGAVVRLLRKPVAKYAAKVGGAVAVALVVFLAAVWAGGAAVAEPTGEGWGAGSGRAWVAAVLVLAAAYLLVSPESWSLAAFYRSKLRRAYATYRATSGEGEDQEVWVLPYADDSVASDRRTTEPGLADFETRAAHESGTPLVICAATTTSSRAVRTHYGIPALSVTFDPDRVMLHVPVDDRGDYLTYDTRTRDLDELGRAFGKRVTTMFAVAISSAAVSPSMGRFRIGLTSMLVTLANVRLGVWVPNPRYTSLMAERLGQAAKAAASNPKDQAEIETETRRLLRETSYPMTRLGYLVKELFGVHDLSDPFLYVTDGGHWENTGLVELLRRRDITEIICIDADSGPPDATRSVSQAIGLSALECAVRVHLDLDVLRAEVRGTNAPDYCVRTVNLGFFERERGGALGVIWYAKPGLTRDMPGHLLAFRESHHDFPRISTLDQFFDTATFLAYRDLGRYNASEIRRARTRLVEVLRRLPDEPAGASVAERLRTAVERTPGATPYDDWLVEEMAGAATALHADDARFCSDVLAALTGAVEDRPPRTSRTPSSGLPRREVGMNRSPFLPGEKP